MQDQGDNDDDKHLEVREDAVVRRPRPHCLSWRRRDVDKGIWRRRLTGLRRHVHEGGRRRCLPPAFNGAGGMRRRHRPHGARPRLLAGRRDRWRAGSGIAVVMAGSDLHGNLQRREPHPVAMVGVALRRLVRPNIGNKVGLDRGTAIPHRRRRLARLAAQRPAASSVGPAGPRFEFANRGGTGVPQGHSPSHGQNDRRHDAHGGQRRTVDLTPERGLAGAMRDKDSNFDIRS
mmetsp:Transcript_103182/g.291353  ORF Transcript_103182/g.291353 Transcript_103182/m.291353 type:complete len:232 (+) Transcript_103182:232-927(+)